MGWKTYLVMYFGTGNGVVSDIVKKVEALGFNSVVGPVDFVYDWEEKVPTKQEIFALADKLSVALRGTGAVFNIDSHN
jgi:hypothetical protein